MPEKIKIKCLLGFSWSFSANCHFYQWRRSFVTPTLCLLCVIGSRVTQAKSLRTPCGCVCRLVSGVKELPSSTCEWLVLVESAVFSESAEITTLAEPNGRPCKAGWRNVARFANRESSDLSVDDVSFVAVVETIQTIRVREQRESKEKRYGSARTTIQPPSAGEAFSVAGFGGPLQKDS